MTFSETRGMEFKMQTIGHTSSFTRRLAAIVVGLAALAFVASALPSKASAAAAFDVKATWGPTNLPPGGEAQFLVQARNIGDALPANPIVISDELPEGMTISQINFPVAGIETTNFGWCSGVGTRKVTCEVKKGPPNIFNLIFNQAVRPRTENAGQPTGYVPLIFVKATVDPGATGVGTNVATVAEKAGPVQWTDTDQIQFSSEPRPFGITPGSYLADVFDGEYPQGSPSRTAGDHPFELRVNFDLNSKLGIGTDGTQETTTVGALRTAEVTLPRGMIGNPEATPKCNPADFLNPGAFVYGSTQCPPETQVGYLNIQVIESGQNFGKGGLNDPNGNFSRVAIYNMDPPKGVPADFAFTAGGLIQGHIYPELDPAQNYAIKTVTPNITSLMTVRGSEVNFWGVPGDPAHSKWRYFSKPQSAPAISAPFGAAIRPLLTNPMDCGFDNGGARIRVESYTEPGKFTPIEEYGNPLNVTGCDDPRIRFDPSLSLQPTSREAGAPTGLDVHLEVPQRNDIVSEAKELYAKEGSVKGISTPPMKKAVVTFPDGMTLSPSAAQGLGSCTPEQIGLGTNDPIRCPDNSQYGTLTLHTPILPESNPPKGFIYIAKQGDNPFHNFLSLYLGIEEPERGILVKIPARIDLDSQTGQITTTFDDLPQFPVSDMQMSFKGGARAGLVNPTTCGQKTIRAEFFSWAQPQTPKVVENSYTITNKPDGSACVSNLAGRPFKPVMSAGTANPLGGAYSPFAFRLTRTDDDQEFSQIEVKLPQGLVAKFAGVSICSDAAIAQAEGRTGAGDGGLEQRQPSCPAGSQVGTTQVGAGVGVPLSYVPGNVYLAGPYKGAPMSIVVISPVVIGPFDLGVISVRTALRVDPVTAQATALSDPFPQIYQGIPVRIRDIRLNMDRPEFTLNPTNCKEQQVAAHVTGTGGELISTADDTAVDMGDRFQAANCAAMPFGPKLSLRLFGGTRRGAHPKFQAVLKARPGDANIGRASVALPHSEFLDQAHIRTICTRVQFAADNCPAGAVYGFATAVTPLFDEPLSGPVYLRSSDNPLPDLVAALKGPDAQPIEIELSGRIDSVNQGIRNTFDVVPDAPVTSFKLTMQGGKKGLLVNSVNLCNATQRATAIFGAQNGRKVTLRPALQNSCGKKKSKPSSGAKRRR